jgi:ComF family protein
VAGLPRSPAACSRCALPLAANAVCGRCLRHPPAIDAAIAAFEYRFPIDRLVQRFKFAGDLAVGRWLGEQLAGATAAAAMPDLVVAPPLAWARLRERGFNQAVELARVVASAHSLRLDIAALEKARETTPQPGLGRVQRQANLRDAFRATRRWHGEHVAIVDDVMTTGATIDSIARVLRQAGASRVSAWIVARTPL